MFYFATREYQRYSLVADWPPIIFQPTCIKNTNTNRVKINFTFKNFAEKYKTFKDTIN